MTKTYRGRDKAKGCHYENCKRKVHAHFGKFGYCSTHYSLKWREQIITENKLQRKLLRVIEKSLLFKCKDSKVQALMRELKDLEKKYEGRDDPFQRLMLLSGKRFIWSEYAGIKGRI